MRTLKTKNRMLSLFQDDRIIAVIDTETTGINSNKDRIVQFSGKKYRIRDQKMEQIAEMDIYIKAPFPMPEAAMRVNGITDEFLAELQQQIAQTDWIRLCFEDSVIRWSLPRMDRMKSCR